VTTRLTLGTNGQQRYCQGIADDVVLAGSRHTVAGRRDAGGRRSVTSDRYVAVVDSSSSEPRHDVQLPTFSPIAVSAFVQLPPPAIHRYQLIHGSEVRQYERNDCTQDSVKPKLHT